MTPYTSAGIPRHPQPAPKRVNPPEPPHPITPPAREIDPGAVLPPKPSNDTSENVNGMIEDVVRRMLGQVYYEPQDDRRAEAHRRLDRIMDLIEGRK